MPGGSASSVFTPYTRQTLRRARSRSPCAFSMVVGWYLPPLLGLGLLVAPSGAMPQQNSFDSFRAASPQPSASQHSDPLPSNPGSVPPSNSVQEIPQIYLGCRQDTKRSRIRGNNFQVHRSARGFRPLRRYVFSETPRGSKSLPTRRNSVKRRIRVGFLTIRPRFLLLLRATDVSRCVLLVQYKNMRVMSRALSAVLSL